MKNRKVLTVLGMAVVVIAVLFFGFSAKVYPVASVNSRMISAKALSETNEASFAYFSKIVDPAYVAERGQERFALEVKRATLDTLIELTLVDEKLEDFFEPATVEQEALRRVANTTTTEKTAEAVREVMGLSLEDFKKIILLPEARRQLLEEEFAKLGENYEAWATEARRVADVTIFLTDFKWRSGGDNCPSFCVEINAQPSILEEIKNILPSTSTPQGATSPGQ